MNNPEMFRPKSNLINGLGIFIFCTGLTGAYFLDSDLGSRLTTIFINTLICSIAYLLFIRPKVTFYDEGIVIDNPIHRYRIGWRDIDSIEARYTMYVLLGTQKIHAWAAPGPGRYHARSVHPNELKGMNIPDLHNMRPGESPRTHSGVATYLARVRHENFRNSNFASFEFAREIDMNAVAIVVSLCVLTIASLIF